jgi:hypothetical protein
MHKYFIFTLLSSWIISPAGILIAHYFGIANSPTVLLILIGAGINFPFQLLLNECLAPAVSKGRFKLLKTQLLLILILQFSAYFYYVNLISSIKYFFIEIVIQGILLIGSNILSYYATLEYYKLVISKKINRLQSIIFGAISGVVIMLVYLIYCLLWHFGFEHDSIWLLLVWIIPGMAQWYYVKTLYVTEIKLSFSLDAVMEAKKRPKYFDIFFFAILFLLFSLSSTFLREMISLQNKNYTGVIFIGLNILFSFGNTFLRACFMIEENTIRFYKRNYLYFILVVLICLIAYLYFINFKILGGILVLFILQASILVTIESGRKILPV